MVSFSAWKRKSSVGSSLRSSVSSQSTLDADDVRAPPKARVYEIGVAAAGLKNGVGAVDVFVVVEELPASNVYPAKGVVVGETETVRDDHNPNFVQTCLVSCASRECEQKKIRVTFCDRQQALLGNPRHDVLAYTEFFLGDILAHKERCLDLHLMNKDGDVDTRCGVAFISTEQWVPEGKRADKVSVRFRPDDDSDLHGAESKYPYFFAISREHSHSPGQWKRVYTTPIVRPPKVGKAPEKGPAFPPGNVLAKVLSFKEPTRPLLIEFYQMRGAAKRGNEYRGPTVLCGYTKTSLKALRRMMLNGGALHLDCEPGSGLQSGKLMLEGGSLVSFGEGERKTLHLGAQCFRWYRTDKEIKEAERLKNYVDSDETWTKDVIIDGSVMKKTWKGSSFRVT